MDTPVEFGRTRSSAPAAPAGPLTRSEPFHLLAKPTGPICNLDCEYCFFLSKEALYPGDRFRMSDELLDTYLRQFMEANPDGEITIAWQGGEPTLMGVDFFRRAVALAEQYRRPAQQVQHTIQTNGTLLTDEWCQLLAEHRFLVGISIDGPPAMHDRYRVAQYIERYREFEKVLNLKHPEIKIVSGSGPSASGAYFDYAWTELKKLNPALIDEHYYMPPEWFQSNASRYDNYDRKGIKVFAGEYAAHGKDGEAPESRNTWVSALSEAAFMTGLERNADVVHMASYAPLLAHVDAWQWRPDLIWFDNLKTIGTPNYYVQKMFSTHRGTHVIPVLQSGKPLSGADSLFASGTIDKDSSRVYIKLINTSAKARPVLLSTEGASVLKTGDISILKSGGLYDFNSISDPELIYPSSKPVTITGGKLNVQLEPRSASVVILGYKRLK